MRGQGVGCAAPATARGFKKLSSLEKRDSLFPLRSTTSLTFAYFLHRLSHRLKPIRELGRVEGGILTVLLPFGKPLQTNLFSPSTGCDQRCRPPCLSLFFKFIVLHFMCLETQEFSSENIPPVPINCPFRYKTKECCGQFTTRHCFSAH